MVKIKISYEQPEELAEIIRRLHYSGKIRQQDKRHYSIAYIVLDMFNVT